MMHCKRKLGVKMMLDETLRAADEAVRKTATDMDRDAAAMRAARIRYEKHNVKLLKEVGALQMIKIDKYEEEIDDLKAQNEDLKRQLADAKKSQATNAVNDKLAQDNAELRQQVTTAQQQKNDALSQVAEVVKDRDTWHQKCQASDQKVTTLTDQLKQLRGDLTLLAGSKTIARQLNRDPLAQAMWNDVANVIKMIAAGKVTDDWRQRW